MEALADGLDVVVGAALLAAQQPLLHDLLRARKVQHKRRLLPRVRLQACRRQCYCHSKNDHRCCGINYTKIMQRQWNERCNPPTGCENAAMTHLEGGTVLIVAGEAVDEELVLAALVHRILQQPVGHLRPFRKETVTHPTAARGGLLAQCPWRPTHIAGRCQEEGLPFNHCRRGSVLDLS